MAPSAPDPMFARLIQDCGYKLFHLAGNGMHRSLVLPDCSMVTMTEMAHRAGTIAEVLDIPMLVDGETGYGGPLQTARAVRDFERAGVAGIRFEDSMFGQNGIDDVRPPVPVVEMADKIKAAADARTDKALVLVVRCDARAVESRDQVLQRIGAYVEAARRHRRSSDGRRGPQMVRRDCARATHKPLAAGGHRYDGRILRAGL